MKSRVVSPKLKQCLQLPEWTNVVFLMFQKEVSQLRNISQLLNENTLASVKLSLLTTCVPFYGFTSV